eukprot:403362982
MYRSLYINNDNNQNQNNYSNELRLRQQDQLREQIEQEIINSGRMSNINNANNDPRYFQSIAKDFSSQQLGCIRSKSQLHNLKNIENNGDDSPFGRCVDDNEQGGRVRTRSFGNHNNQRQPLTNIWNIGSNRHSTEKLRPKHSIADQIHELAESPELKGCNKQSIFTLVGVILFIFAISFLFITYWQDIVHKIEPFFIWFEQNFYQGLIIYIGLFLVFTFFMIPTSFLILAGSLTFSRFLGQAQAFFLCLFLTVFSTTLGGSIAFIFGRLFLRNFIRKNLTRKIKLFRAIDLGLKQGGLKLVILMRITPLIPNNCFHYIMSVTSLRMKDYILGNSLGMIPFCALYIYVGVQLNNLDEVQEGNYGLGPWQSVIIVLGALTVCMLTLALFVFAKEEMRKLIELDRQQQIHLMDAQMSKVELKRIMSSQASGPIQQRKSIL